MGIADQLVTRLVKCGIKAQDIRGCTAAEIKRLQTKAGTPLPPDYAQVLQQIGRGAGEFISDLNAFYPSLLTLTATRRKALAEYAVLPDDAFVIADRYGDQTLFVRLSEGSAQTPVYYWNAERPRRTKRAFKSVWAFIQDELKGYEYACGR